MNGSGGKITEYVPKDSAPNCKVSFSSSCGTVTWCPEREETERITTDRPGHLNVARRRGRGLRATAQRDRHGLSMVGQLVLVVVVMSY